VPERDKVGKPLGADLKERKVTLPLSRLISIVPASEKAELMTILGKEAIDDGDVHRVVELMQRHDVLPYTVGEARAYAQRAKEHLARLPDLPGKEMLAGFADFTVSRDM